MRLCAAFIIDPTCARAGAALPGPFLLWLKPRLDVHRDGAQPRVGYSELLHRNPRGRRPRLREGPPE